MNIMKKLVREDLFSLEQYAERRRDFRKRVIAHKKDRRVGIGAHAALYFEDRLTIQYQIQEMLRIERIFEREAIEEELAIYNPLIPDEKNLKATFMLEYEDVAERQKALADLVGIENLVWVRVEGYEKVFAVADEDLDRATEDKTSAVHFVRFELDDGMVAALRAGAEMHIGIDHAAYGHQISPLPSNHRDALTADFS